MSSSNFNIVSCWSKAGVGTSIVLEYSPPANTASQKAARLVFDIGATPCFDESIRSDVVLISHGHVDHIGAIFSHARAHAVVKSGSVPTYYVPAPLVQSLNQAREAMSALDAANDGTGSRKSSLIQMNIVGVHPGDEIVLPIRKYLNGVQLFARVFGVQHAGCPAVGYVLGSRHAPKLKEEYRNLAKEQIRELIAAGVSIKAAPIDVLEVAYTGDTCARGLLSNVNSDTGNEGSSSKDGDEIAQDRNALHLKQAFQSPLIFCEATFLKDCDKERQLSKDRGHVHIDELMPILRSHGWMDKSTESTTQLVLLHLSARYGAQQALDEIARVISKEMAPYCSVAISSLTDPKQEEEWETLVKDNGCIILADYMPLLSK